MSIKTLTPIANAVINNPIGLKVSVASTTTLTIAAGVSMDSQYAQNMFVDSALTLSSATVGAGGLDKGVLAQTIYFVYIISDSLGINPINCLMSTSSTTPTMPTGYDTFKGVGLASVDGSSHFITLVQTGNGNERTYWYDTPVSVLSGGTSATFAAIDLTAVMPVASCIARFNALFTPNTAADTAALSIGGSSSTTGVVTISGVVAAKAQGLQVSLPVAVVLDTTLKPEIQYKVAASGALSLSIVSFTYSIE